MEERDEDNEMREKIKEKKVEYLQMKKTIKEEYSEKRKEKMQDKKLSVL